MEWGREYYEQNLWKVLQTGCRGNTITEREVEEGILNQIEGLIMFSERDDQHYCRNGGVDT